MASTTTTSTCHGPAPNRCANTSPMNTPSATPTVTSATRRRRRPYPSPRLTIAATGAKNGVGWPTMNRASDHASAAATAHWAMYHPYRRSRSTRWRSGVGRSAAGRSAREEDIGPLTRPFSCVVQPLGGGPGPPVRAIRDAVPGHGPPVPHRFGGVEPDQQVEVRRARPRAGTDALDDDHGAGRELVPLGVPLRGPVEPSPAPGAPGSQRRQRPRDHPRHGGVEPAPAGVEVVHPQHRGVERRAQPASQVGLARPAGTVEADYV